MARPQLPPGRLGTIRITTMASGSVQAAARIRDDAGTLHRLKVCAGTKEHARQALQAQAERIRDGESGPLLDIRATVADAAVIFLDDKRRSGLVEASTVESYESSVRTVVIPACGAVPLTDLTVRRWASSRLWSR